MKYKKLTGVILKKQNYKEADQIITLWSREAGKIRFLGKSLRLPKSKLNSAMQDLSLVQIDLAGRSSLQTLIGAQAIMQYINLKTDLVKMINAFYASELMLKMTADEHPNESAFELLVAFFSELESSQVQNSFSLVDEFALNLAKTLGFGNPKKVDSHVDVRSFIENLIERNLKTESLLNQVI